MEHFYIITNTEKDPGLVMTKKIQAYLEEHGKTCQIQNIRSSRNGGSYKYTNVENIPEEIDCALVLGGDGTLLQAARDLVFREIPLLGVNMGTLGYLAEIERDAIFPALNQLIEGNFAIEKRMMLEGTAYHQSKRLMKDFALNDIVITRSGRLRIVEFKIYVNDAFLCSYSADGIIISTPTGSTGYNLSAGGPLVAPEASLILLTTIAAHTLTSRPIVLPDDVVISIEISGDHNRSQDGADMTFDGDTALKLNVGDKIFIQRSSRQTKLIKTNDGSFVEILRKKMNQN